MLSVAAGHDSCTSRPATTPTGTCGTDGPSTSSTNAAACSDGSDRFPAASVATTWQNHDPAPRVAKNTVAVPNPTPLTASQLNPSVRERCTSSPPTPTV